MSEAPDWIEEGLRYERAGVLHRALALYQAALDASDDPAVTARALRHQSDVYRTQCDWDRALQTARRSAAIAEAAGLPALWAEARNAEAAVYLSRGEFQHARQILERLVDTATDDRIRGIALQNLGSIAARESMPEIAEQYFLESFRCFVRSGYLRGEAIAYNNHAAFALDRGDYRTALDSSERAMAAAREVEDLELLAVARLNHAEALAAIGDFANAEHHATAALGYFAVTQNAWRRVEALRTLGDCSRRQGYTAMAMRYYDAGLRLAEEIGAVAAADELRTRFDELASGSEPTPAE